MVASDSARGGILFLLLFAASHSALGLDSDRTIAQFYHTAWTIEDGVPGRIEMLAQTTDGYLWLGTFRGLFRFDGVRFERYEPERGDPFPSQDIFSLLATPDGGLWIGFRTGGATFLENGRGHSYGERGVDRIDRKSIRIGSRGSHLGGNDPRTLPLDKFALHKFALGEDRNGMGFLRRTSGQPLRGQAGETLA